MLQRTKERRARIERQNVYAFKTLVATPATGAVTFPGAGRVCFRSVAGCSAGVTAATVVAATTKSIKAPALAAGGMTFQMWIEKGAQVTAAVGFEVMLDNGIGKFVKIAQG